MNPQEDTELSLGVQMALGRDIHWLKQISSLSEAIRKHRDTSLRYGISRSIDRELWEVLDDK